MTHFGILCPPAIGHLNPMCALAKELQSRGHEVTLFQVPEMEKKIKTTGLEFQAIGAAPWVHLNPQIGNPTLAYAISLEPKSQL